MATKAVMTNASGLARFAALLGRALPDPDGDSVPDADVEAGPPVVVVPVLVEVDFRVAWLKVVFREIGIPVPPELAAVPIPVPMSMEVVALTGTVVVV